MALSPVALYGTVPCGILSPVASVACDYLNWLKANRKVMNASVYNDRPLSKMKKDVLMQLQEALGIKLIDF